MMGEPKDIHTRTPARGRPDRAPGGVLSVTRKSQGIVVPLKKSGRDVTYRKCIYVVFRKEMEGLDLHCEEQSR